MTTPNDTVYVERKQLDGTKIDVTCPKAVDAYNQYMSGVDKGDQMRNYYMVRLRCMKYYKYIFWFLFDVSITNTYILSPFIPSTSIPNMKCTLKCFRLTLATELISTYCSRKRLGRPKSITHASPPLPSPESGGPPLAQSPRVSTTPSNTFLWQALHLLSFTSQSYTKKANCVDLP